eukprot:364871-Chlamydomonas_euryale.AAC.10
MCASASGWPPDWSLLQALPHPITCVGFWLATRLELAPGSASSYHLRWLLVGHQTGACSRLCLILSPVLALIRLWRYAFFTRHV